MLALAIHIATAAAASPPTWSSHDGKLFVDDQPLLIKGVNWYGFETKQGVVHGLYAQPPSVFYKILEDHQINAVRLPVDLDLVLHDRKHGYIKPEPDEDGTSCFLPISASHDDAALAQAALNASSCGGPSPLMKNSSFEVLQILVQELGKRGILVLLDLHCLSTRGTNASPVFFDTSHSVQDTLAGWAKLARVFGDVWNVLGADVFNEPFGATWAEGKPTDMDAFASQVASTIEQRAPNCEMARTQPEHLTDCLRNGGKLESRRGRAALRGGHCAQPQLHKHH